MKTEKWFYLLVAGALVMGPGIVRADNDAAQDHPNLTQEIEKKYNLTDQQMKEMESKGMSPSQMVKAADLAKLSGKSLDDILKMRYDEKMGWGKIAKELGVPPSSLGQAVRDLHGDRDEVRDKHKDKDDREEAREKRRERREERAEHRDHGDKDDKKSR